MRVLEARAERRKGSIPFSRTQKYGLLVYVSKIRPCKAGYSVQFWDRPPAKYIYIFKEAWQSGLMHWS